MRDRPAATSARRAGVVIAAAVVVAALGMRLTVLAPDGAPSPSVRAGDAEGRSTATAPASGRAGDDEACPARGHRDTRAASLSSEDIVSLPADFSFYQVAADGCSPVRWNPCRPVHYVINPTDAPPTGVADVKEAFRRLARATGMTYVDDGLTDERGGQDRAYQPERYGRRWAPILVHWVLPTEGPGDVQVVGSGLPVRMGDVYVTADLSLNPAAITDTDTRTTVGGGFGDKRGGGHRAIGPGGVTWGRIILHELAHITGLGHVRDRAQLMYPETTDQTGHTGFNDGDRAGLKALGRAAGCLDSPTPGGPAGR